MNKMLLVAGLMLALSQTACMSLSTMQTGETLPPGQTQWTFGSGSYTYEQSYPYPDDGKDSLTGEYYEMSFRHGLGDRMDWGARLMFLGNAVVDLKYQFIDGVRFDAAVGAGLGYLNISSDDGTGEEESTTMLDVVVPLYLSYQYSPLFTPYLAPRLVWRRQSAEAEGSQTLLGVTAGLKIGVNYGAYLEFGYQKDLRSDFSARQFNFAWFWRPRYAR